jgi:hypothetical protein
VLDGKKAASHYALSLAIFVNPFLPALRWNVSADQVFTNNADSGTDRPVECNHVKIASRTI